MLSDLFISKVRVKILEFFITNPGAMFHVREIVRRVDEEINAVRRELARMEKFGLMASEWRANRRYYHFKKEYIFFNELLSMVSKTTGLGGSLLAHKTKLGKVKFSVIFGRFLRREKPLADSVDLLVVGTVVLPELAALVREEEARLGREVNYTVMTDEEFAFRKERRDPFIVSILSQPRVMLIGDEEALVS